MFLILAPQKLIGVNTPWSAMPLVRLLPPFVLGIVAAMAFGGEKHIFPTWLVILLPLIFLMLLSYVAFFNQYRRRFWFGIIASFALLISGWQITVNASAEAELKIGKEKGKILVGKLIATPKFLPKKVVAEVRVTYTQTTFGWESAQGNVLLSLPPNKKSLLLERGDLIAFTPRIKELKSNINPEQFDYAQYLRQRLIRGQGFLRSHDWVLLEKGETGIWHWVKNIRDYGISKLNNTLEAEEAAVAGALIFGYKNNLNSDIQQVFSTAGAMHVLAVSGLHVGIVFLVCNFLLGFIRRLGYNWLFTIITLLIIWSYALVTGLSPSVMRAATMFSFVVVGQNLNRHTNIYNSIAASAFLLLLINPYLIAEVGFQLSYIAVIGIVWLQPKINAWYHSRWKLANKIWSLTAVSIAAQTATFPLSLLYFNLFPNYFLLSNLVVIPAAFVILISGLAFVGLAEIPLLGEWLGKLLQAEVWLLNSFVSFVESLPGSASSWVITSLEACVIYIIVIQVVKWLSAPTGVKFITLLVFFLVFCFSFTTRLQHINTQRELIVYHIPYESAFNFISQKDNLLISSLDPKNDAKIIEYHLKPHWRKIGLKGEKFLSTSALHGEYRQENLYAKQNYFQFYTLRVAFVNQDMDFFPDILPPKVDVLIVSGWPRIKAEKLLTLFRPKYVVTDGACSPYYEKSLQSAAQNKSLHLHAVREKGFFRFPL